MSGIPNVGGHCNPAVILAPAGAPARLDPPTDPVASAPAKSSVQPLSFRPNSDNLIEITPELAFRAPGTPRVPFDQVFFPKPTFREVTFALTLVSPGPQPSAVVNKRIVALGDAIDGFTLRRASDVDDDGLWLTRDYFRVRIPFQEAPVTVRFAQP